MTLPPGQFETKILYRFGLPKFAGRSIANPRATTLEIAGDVTNPGPIDLVASNLAWVEQVSDFHCVTTWSVRNLVWSGVLFRDLYHQVIVPVAKPQAEASFVVFKAQDGYNAALPLADLLKDDVLIADRLNDAVLDRTTGAPFRLIAPAHYAYKQVKHLKAIHLLVDSMQYKSSGLSFMEHPRARVAEEERASGLPNWLLRPLYALLIQPTKRRFARLSPNKDKT